MRRISVLMALALLVGCSAKASVTTGTVAPQAASAAQTTVDACGCPVPRHHLRQFATTVFDPVGPNIELTFTATDVGSWEWDWSKLVLKGPDGIEHHVQAPPGESSTVKVDGDYSSKAEFPLGAPIPSGNYSIYYDDWGYVTTRVA